MALRIVREWYHLTHEPSGRPGGVSGHTQVGLCVTPGRGKEPRAPEKNVPQGGISHPPPHL